MNALLKSEYKDNAGEQVKVTFGGESHRFKVTTLADEIRSDNGSAKGGKDTSNNNSLPDIVRKLKCCKFD